MNNEKLNEVLKVVNCNMDNYNKDIALRMKISDNLEIKALKQSAERLCEELGEYSQEVSQNELLDPIENQKYQKKMKPR